MIGALRNLSPLSDQSLRAGEGDTDLFGLDRGVVFFLAAAEVGTYELVVRQTNAAAANRPTRDTTILVTVRP